MVAGGTGFLVRSRGPDADADHISDWIVPKKRKMARQRNLALAGTNPALRSCLVKCSNLERGESMKDPVSIFGCWRGFSFGAAWQHPLRTSAKGANKGVEMPIAVLLARTILTTTRSSAVAGSENGAPRPCR